MPRVALVLSLSVSLSVGACSTNASIRRARGPALEAEIIGSDADTLRVRDDDYRTSEMVQGEVIDIDHPGNVAIGVGAGVVALGALLALVVLKFPDLRWDEPPRTEADRREGAAVVGLGYGLSGVAVMIWGGVTYARSRRNARAFEDALARDIGSRPSPASPAATIEPDPEPAPPPAGVPQVAPAPPAEPPR
jgi:hypothetical protein